MNIREIKLRNSVHPDRPLCSWRGCLEGANHHAGFEFFSNTVGKWLPRLMGLCDRHRGIFKRKHMTATKR